MSTEAPVTLSSDQIQKIIREKGWYGLDPESGAFDWQLSIQKISLALGITDQMGDVQEAFESGFTPESLTTVVDEQGETLPLIEVLARASSEIHVWTVGDQEWQMIKIARTGVSRFLPTEHIHCARANKLDTLGILLNQLSQTYPNNTYTVLVVDDKQTNIDQVYQLVHTRLPEDSVIAYHLKLQDDLANTQALYEFIQNWRTENPSRQLISILDFDGVIADTDSVLFGPVVDNVNRLLQKLNRKSQS